MAVSLATYDLFLEVLDTPDLDVSTLTDPETTHRIADASVASPTVAKPTLSPTTTVVCDTVYGDTITLSAGAKTLDLTALDQGNLPNIDMTGKKVQLIKIFAYANNSAAIKFIIGATNGYGIFLGTSGQIELGAGAACLFYYPDKLPDVAAGAKDIDCSSSDADAKFDIILAAG